MIFVRALKMIKKANLSILQKTDLVWKPLKSTIPAWFPFWHYYFFPHKRRPKRRTLRKNLLPKIIKGQKALCTAIPPLWYLAPAYGQTGSTIIDAGTEIASRKGMNSYWLMDRKRKEKGPFSFPSLLFFRLCGQVHMEVNNQALICVWPSRLWIWRMWFHQRQIQRF